MRSSKEKVDIFVAGAGSGGTLPEPPGILKKNPAIKTVIVEPEGSILNGGKPGPHRTEGIGLEFIPSFMNRQHFDVIYTIREADAFSRVAELAKNEGLLIGSSSGAAYEAALREAEKAPKGTNIVVVFRTAVSGTCRHKFTNFIEEECFEEKNINDSWRYSL